MTDRPDIPKGPLAKAEAEVKAMVKPCRAGSCFGRYRVVGLEYDTGGCLTYDQALRIARKASAIGVEKWQRNYAINLSGERKRA
jgi:hypothetical protein